MHLSQTAFAKINLALHVRRRRDDGYHELETLFAFAATGDRLTARQAGRDKLRIHGEFASQLTDPFGNLVSRALSVLPRPGGLAVMLEKTLPVAAGLGGGSADAGAVFRLVREAHGLPDDWRERAARLGADVPACVESRSCVGRGTGTELLPVDDDMADTPLLLVNPRIAVPTEAIFAAWDGVDRGPLPDGPASLIAGRGRNDLEAPAIAHYPEIARVLDALRATGASLARMSGSGATCFATYASRDERDEAAGRLETGHPRWWQMTTSLR